ncbi:MAG: aminoglycoside phosphotransferase family protein [bacterium]|nr:aminoglycoside phosphotransferase family protein [bacterium]
MVRPITPSEHLQRAAAQAIRAEIIQWRPVSGGFSSAGLWVISTAGGVRRFLKAATTDDNARFLRDEVLVYEQLDEPFMPELEAWVDDGDRPFLIIEDLSDRHWPPPWSIRDIDAVQAVCSAIAATPPPSGLGDEARTALARNFWPKVAADPAAIEALGVASPVWLEAALPRIIEVEREARVTGEALVHADIRSDNLCVGDRVKVIDWNWAFVGNPMIDVVAWLPSLYLEGGPAPWDLVVGEAPLVARIAGYFLLHATLPRNPDVRPDIRRFQRSQGVVALQWLAHELGLGPVAA